MPFFSIIMPVFNGEKYLERAASSVCKQSFSDFELLLVDDCSLDHSIEIENKLAMADSRIKILRQKVNGGALLARKKGVEAASGKYHMFVDCDDILERDALSTIFRNLSTHSTDLLIFNFFKVLPLGDKSTADSFLAVNHDYSGKELLALSVKYFGLLNSLCTKAVKSDISQMAFAKYNQNLSMAEDLLISLQIFQKIKSAYYINSCLYDYYDNPSSSMHKVQLKFFDEYEFVYNEEVRVLRNNHLGDNLIVELTQKQAVKILADYFFYTTQNQISFEEFKALGDSLLHKSYFHLAIEARNLGPVWSTAYIFLKKRNHRPLYWYFSVLRVGHRIKHFHV